MATKRRHKYLVAAVIAPLSFSSTAWAEQLAPRPRPDQLADWVSVVRTRLAEASAALIVPLVPPTPVKVTWSAHRRASIEFGAEMATMVAADLDGDGRAELYVVSEDEVRGYDLAGKVTERGRSPLPAELAVAPPRDPLAVALAWPAAAAAPASLAVRVASRARGARYAWTGGKLVEVAPFTGGFPLCVNDVRELVTGRNFFGTVDNPSYGTVCRSDLVDATGAPQLATATLADHGKLHVEVTAGCSVAPCASTPITAELAEAGASFVLADIDRDGGIDVVLTSAGAPGDADSVRVVRLADVRKKKPWTRRGFTAGVVAVAVGDFDGDGDVEVLCATRLLGSTRIDLWQLNK